MTPKEKDEELNLRAARTVADIKQQFGRPYFLKSEDPRMYDRILLDVVRTKWPTDFIAKMVVVDIANSVWLDLRLGRFAGHAFERLERLNCSAQQPLLLEGTTVKQAMPTSSQNVEPAASDQEPTLGADQFIAVVEPESHGAMIEPSRDVPHSVKMQEEMAVLQGLNTLKSTNFYSRNVSLQLWKEYKSGSIPAAHLVLKKHHVQAEAEIAARNAGIDVMLSYPTEQGETPAPSAPASTTPSIASVSPDEPSEASVASAPAPTALPRDFAWKAA
jgi:hypothetical protein